MKSTLTVSLTGNTYRPGDVATVPKGVRSGTAFPIGNQSRFESNSNETRNVFLRKKVTTDRRIKV